jgi:hypothetical protein
MEVKELLEQLVVLLKGKEKEVSVIKSVEEEERKALFVVLEPDTVDAHGDVYSAKEISKAMTSFNKHCNKANLFHRIELQEAEITQSYLAPTDFVLDTPSGQQTITKGTWIQEWAFPEGAVGDLLWEGVKSGEFTGVSVGCKAIAEDIE